MKDSLPLRFLYRTMPGRLILKLLAGPAFSEVAGRVLTSGISGWFVPYYIRRAGIDMRGVEIPEGGFPSFNAFFTRKRIREGQEEIRPEFLVSPCDGFLSYVKIRKDLVFDIKHTRFSLKDLLKDEELAAKFTDGTALIFRLTPANYHRYCYAVSGEVQLHRRVPGVLHCVRPVATRTLPVYAQNSREYEVITTAEFGEVVQMEIGALMVGKITNFGYPEGAKAAGAAKKETDPACPAQVRAGEEKGYFEFGGSTILLLLQKDRVHISRKLYAGRDENGEVPVRQKDRVAKKARESAKK